LTFGLGIIILQGVSRRKSVAGVNIMLEIQWNLPYGHLSQEDTSLLRTPTFSPKGVLNREVLLVFLPFYSRKMHVFDS
jgi:hypothetical protein